MTLGEKQEKFSRMLPGLYLEAFRQGFEIRSGELYRPPETAALYATDGRGISNSLHTKKLAIDLHLTRNGKYLDKSEDYLPLGIWWESQGGSWGGRFAKPDGNHFSLEHNGVR